MSNKIRNIVVLGHQSSGKTSFTEALALAGGVVSTKGEVERKNTVSDYTPAEQARGASIQTALVPVNFNGYKVNVLDVPGNDDFISEYIGALTVVDGAILLVDASVGVQVGTVKHFNALKKAHVPTFILINKMDKDEAKYEEVLTDIQNKLSKEAVAFLAPVGQGSSFTGYVNAVNMKGYKFNGKTVEEADVTSDYAASAHDAILEEVAKTDDALLEKFFGGEEFTDEEIQTALLKAIAADEITPVLVGATLKNIGVSAALEMVTNYLPSCEGKVQQGKDDYGKDTTRTCDENAPLSAFVFKTIVDPYSGVINLVKVTSGVLHAGDDVATGNGTQRVSMLYSMVGKTLNNATEVKAGDIGAITRLDNIASGTTLSAPKQQFVLPTIGYPNAVIFKAIILKNKNDESKVGPALAKMQLEDPCVEVKRNNETKQLLLGGVSNSHIDFIVEKLKTLYRIEVTTEPMKVVYRESIKKTAEGDGRYVKQSGGSGFYGVVKMRFEPTEESVFAEEVFGGAVPKNYFPAVEKGFFEALKSGPLAGFPVIGVKGVLIDGKYHPVDSNEQAFKMAGILAFKDAYQKCAPIILEPIMRVHVLAPSQYTGDVMSDLNTRRARIQNMEEHEGIQDIEALVPEAEIVDYVTQLKSITQASGTFTREFESYEEVPEYLKEKVIRENKIEQQ